MLRGQLGQTRIGSIQFFQSPAKLRGDAVATTSYPAATASWIALLPTLVDPPQTSRVSPVGASADDACDGQ